MRLAGELTSLLRSMKELHGQVVAEAPVRCEVAGAVVLSRLDILGPVRLTVLAHELGLDPSSVSRSVAALEREGLVRKDPDPSDQRAQQLVLTPAGKDAVGCLRAAFARRLADRTPGFHVSEVEDLADRLGRLNADLATHRAPVGARRENA